MIKIFVSLLLFIPFFCFGQIDSPKTDSLIQERKTVDSLLIVLRDLVKQLKDTTIKDEIKLALEGNVRKIDSLNYIINRICEHDTDLDLCSLRDFIRNNLKQVYDKMDIFASSLKDNDGFSFFKWTNEDSILIFDLKNTINSTRINLITKKNRFNKDLQKRINFSLSTEDYEYDGKKTKWEKQLFCCYFSVQIIRLHIDTKKRGIQRLEIKLLEYLIKNAS